VPAPNPPKIRFWAMVGIENGKVRGWRDKTAFFLLSPVGDMRSLGKVWERTVEGCLDGDRPFFVSPGDLGTPWGRGGAWGAGGGARSSFCGGGVGRKNLTLPAHGAKNIRPGILFIFSFFDLILKKRRGDVEWRNVAGGGGGRGAFLAGRGGAFQGGGARGRRRAKALGGGTGVNFQGACRNKKRAAQRFCSPRGRISGSLVSGRLPAVSQ